MKQDRIAPLDLPLLRPVVTVLECPSRLDIDTAPLEELFAGKGELAAEDTVCRILEDISARLSAMQGARQRAAFDELPQPAERIAAIADQIGLIEVARAARHLATASRQRNGIAMEATMTRLERGFDAAVAQVWNFNVML